MIQSLLDPLVTAIDLMDVVDHALALGAECREKQCHAGADVGAGDLCAGEPIAADDDRPMRIAKNDPRPHRNQFVRKEKARLEHFLEDHHRPFGLRPHDHHDREQVGREERPRAVVDFRNGGTDVIAHAQLLILRHADVIALDANFDTKLLQHQSDRIQVLRHRIFDEKLAARDRGQSDVGPHFDVVAGNGELSSS